MPPTAHTVYTDHTPLPRNAQISHNIFQSLKSCNVLLIVWIDTHVGKCFLGHIEFGITARSFMEWAGRTGRHEKVVQTDGRYFELFATAITYQRLRDHHIFIWKRWAGRSHTQEQCFTGKFKRRTFHVHSYTRIPIDATSMNILRDLHTWISVSCGLIFAVQLLTFSHTLTKVQ